MKPNRFPRQSALHAAAALALVVAISSPASAGDGCCAHCGCHAPCQKVCRLVCEEKKVDVVCWGCKCEDFCLARHDKPGCQHCETVCGDELCACDGVSSVPQDFVWTEWIPGCATMHTRKKLMKKTVSKKVPSFKWVVEDLCETCQAQCPAVQVPTTAAVPLPPLPR